MAIALEARHLVKEYPGVMAVDDVSFAVEEGSCFGLLGPNGAGKTTTVEIIEGVTAATSGEVWYDGEPAGEGYAYRMSYPSLGMLTEVGEELCGKRGTPRFRLAVTSDPDLAARFGAAHRALELSGQALMADERMLGVLAEMMRRYADIVVKPTGTSEPNGVARAMTYLDAHYAEDIDLARLSTVAGLPRFRLIRAFRRETGLTPHAFLVDRRVRAARDMLAEGASPVDAAARSGFYDQAHLTRAFKARVGVTPGAYRSLAA